MYKMLSMGFFAVCLHSSVGFAQGHSAQENKVKVGSKKPKSPPDNAKYLIWTDPKGIEWYDFGAVEMNPPDAYRFCKDRGLQLPTVDYTLKSHKEIQRGLIGAGLKTSKMWSDGSQLDISFWRIARDSDKLSEKDFDKYYDNFDLHPLSAWSVNRDLDSREGTYGYSGILSPVSVIAKGTSDYSDDELRIPEGKVIDAYVEPVANVLCIRKP